MLGKSFIYSRKGEDLALNLEVPLIVHYKCNCYRYPIILAVVCLVKSLLSNCEVVLLCRSEIICIVNVGGKLYQKLWKSPIIGDQFDCPHLEINLDHEQFLIIDFHKKGFCENHVVCCK